MTEFRFGFASGLSLMLSYCGVHRWNCTPPPAGNLINAVNSGDKELVNLIFIDDIIQIDTW